METFGPAAVTRGTKATSGGLFLPPDGAILPGNDEENGQKFRKKGGNLGVRYLTRRLFIKV
jgi:hypothetical protein